MGTVNNFKQPDVLCPKCRNRLPVAGDQVRRDGRWVRLRTDQLVCEPCAIAALPPRKRVTKLRKGEHHEAQDTILTKDCPVIHL